MRNRLSWICLSLVICSGEVPAADAQFHVGDWSGGPQTHPQSKAFQRCHATSTTNGTTISYSLDSQFRWGMSVSSPSWNFGAGTTWNVFMKVGESSDTIVARATSSAPTTLALRVDQPLDFAAMLSSARRLRVIAGAAQLEFAVAGTADAMAALTRCVLQATRPPRPKAKKAGSEPLVSVVTPVDPQEVTAVVTNIGLYGGAGEIKPLPGSDEFSRLPVHAVWKAGFVSAALMVLAGQVDISRVGGVLLEHWQSACRGDLAFVSNPATLGQAPVMRIFTSCQSGESFVSMHQFAIERPQGGVYVISIIRPGSMFSEHLQRLADAYDQRLRSTIMVALSKLQ